MSNLEFQGKSQDAITEFDRRVFSAMDKAQWLGKDFKQYMVEYLALNQPLIPVGQLSGFMQFTAQVAETIQTAEATSSATYTDLATVGPTLSGLPDGEYLVLLGAGLWTDDSTHAAYMSVSVNGQAAADAHSAHTTSMEVVPGMSFFAATLDAGGNNTLTAKYRVDDAAATGSFLYRKMIALRTGNA